MPNLRPSQAADPLHSGHLIYLPTGSQCYLADYSKPYSGHCPTSCLYGYLDCSSTGPFSRYTPTSVVVAVGEKI